jgi:hypothetical protein
LLLNQFARESRNKIISKLTEEETIFIPAYNAENFMKITNEMIDWLKVVDQYWIPNSSHIFVLSYSSVQ